MKLYIKGQQFGKQTVGDINAYLLGVSNSNILATISSDYYSYNGTNGGCTYNGEDIDNLQTASKIDLYLSSTGSLNDSVVVATDVDSTKLVNDIQTAYNSGDSEATVYVNDYLDVQAENNCVIDPTNYYTVCRDSWDFKILSDKEWTITGFDPEIFDITPTSGTGDQEIQVLATSSGYHTGSLKVGDQTLNYFWNSWSISLDNNVTVTGRNVPYNSILITGDIPSDSTVTYGLNNPAEWLNISAVIDNQSADGILSLSGGIAGYAGLNAGEARQATVDFNIYINNKLAWTEQIIYTQETGIIIDIQEPTIRTVDPKSHKLNLKAVANQIPNKWTVTSSTSWMTVTGDSNGLNYTGEINIQANDSTARTGKIILKADDYQTEIEITQTELIFNLDPTYISVDSAAGSFDLDITYNGENQINKTSDVEWLTVSGNIVTYNENTSTERTGKITITDGNTDLICEVYQSAYNAEISVNPTFINADSTAGNQTITVTYTGSTQPTITAPDWITASLTKVSWTENTQTTSRRGVVNFTLDGAGTSLTINQKAKEFITLNKDSFQVDYTAGSYLNGFTANVSVNATSDSSWLTTSVSGSNIAFSVTENTGTATRTGTITVTGGSVSQKFIVTQAYKQAGRLSIAETQQYINSNGGTLTNTVTTTGDVGNLSVSSTQSWCAVSLNNKIVTATISSNPSNNRVAYITISATNANSVSYQITQYQAEQKYIYFESESKSISASGGTITNKLITNGTGTSYSSNKSWASVSSSGQVTVQSNSGSSRSAVITASNTSGTASYTIYQAAYSTDKPIWEETIYTEQTTNSFIEYHIDLNGSTIYAGKAYREPNKSYIQINVSGICSNYISVMPFPTIWGNNQTGFWKRTFTLVTSTGNTQGYTFYNDWTYNEEDQPVSKIADYRAPFIVSGPDTYFTIGTDKYTVNGTYKKDISNLLCGTEIKVYKNNSLYWTYTVDSTDKNYVIYWANKFGGWDFLPIKGNDLRTDNVTAYTFNQLGYDVKYLNVVKPTWKLYTGWIKGNLNDLIGSVDVRLYDIQKDRFYNVNVTDTSADYKTYKNSGNHLVSYEINVEMANDYLRK